MTSNVSRSLKRAGGRVRMRKMRWNLSEGRVEFHRIQPALPVSALEADLDATWRHFHRWPLNRPRSGTQWRSVASANQMKLTMQGEIKKVYMSAYIDITAVSFGGWRALRVHLKFTSVKNLKPAAQLWNWHWLHTHTCVSCNLNKQGNWNHFSL